MISNWKDTRAPMFTAALFTITKIQKEPKHPSIDGWIKKIWEGFPGWLSVAATEARAPEGELVPCDKGSHSNEKPGHRS